MGGRGARFLGGGIPSTFPTRNVQKEFHKYGKKYGEDAFADEVNWAWSGNDGLGWSSYWQYPGYPDDPKARFTLTFNDQVVESKTLPFSFSEDFDARRGVEAFYYKNYAVGHPSGPNYASSRSALYETVATEGGRDVYRMKGMKGPYYVDLGPNKYREFRSKKAALQFIKTGKTI